MIGVPRAMVAICIVMVKEALGQTPNPTHRYRRKVTSLLNASVSPAIKQKWY